MSSADGVSREVAWRVFADEYDDATLAFKEGDDDRAPNYVVTPTGAKINRLFAVGVLTETENVGNDGDMYRARISDPTGAFVAYAGQYQKDAMSFFADADPPMFVAVVGKARTYEPDDGDRIYTSIRPEEVNGVDGATRDRWNVQTARQTLARIDAVASYFRGTAETDGANALLARLHDLDATAEHYDLDAAYLTGLRRQCLEVLADLADEEVDEDDARIEIDVEAPAGGTTAAEPGVGDEGPDAAGTAAADDDEAVDDAAPGSVTDEDAAADVDAGTGAESDAAATDDTEPSAVEEADNGGGFDAGDFDDVSQEPVESDGDGTEPEEAAGAETSDAGAETEVGAATETADVDGAEEPSVGEADEAETADAAGAADAESGEVAGSSTASDADQAVDATATDEAGMEGATNAGGDEVEVDAEELEEGEWEWDEGERERLEDEFGAEFSSAADLDEDAGEAPEPGAADDADAADTGVADADEPSTDARVAEEDEDGAVPSAGDEATAEAAEESADTGTEEPEPAEAEAEGEDAVGDPREVVLAVLEDAEPDGVSRAEAVERAAGRGIDGDAAADALDDLLMEGMCYETDDVVKPL